LEEHDIRRVIAPAILAEDCEEIRLGLKSQDRAPLLDQASKQERIKADVGAHVDNLHARPNESPQQDRFIAAHPTKAMQTKGNEPIQRGGAHFSIPNIYLAPPEGGVIEIVKQGRDHSARRSPSRRNKVGAQLIEALARAQPALNQFDFRNGEQKHPQE
jgi:hypothetical protein